MPLNIDGAGRSRSLACLPTARGTGEARYLEEFSSRQVLVAFKAKRGGLWGPGPLLRANFRTRRPESQRGGGQRLRISHHLKNTQKHHRRASEASRGLQGPPGTSRTLQGSSGVSKKGTTKTSKGCAEASKVGAPRGGFSAGPPSQERVQEPLEISGGSSQLQTAYK